MSHAVNRVSLGTFDVAGNKGAFVLCSVSSPKDGSLIAAVSESFYAPEESYLVKVYVVTARISGDSAVGRVIRLNNAPAAVSAATKRNLRAVPGLLSVNQTVDIPSSVGRPRTSVLAPTVGLLFVASDGLGARALRLDDVTVHADVPPVSEGIDTLQGPFNGAVAESDGRLYILSFANPAPTCGPCSEEEYRSSMGGHLPPNAVTLPIADRVSGVDYCTNCDTSTGRLFDRRCTPCGAVPFLKNAHLALFHFKLEPSGAGSS
eukprot:tig00021221_g19338.t1